jgi:hypothetical protein
MPYRIVCFSHILRDVKNALPALTRAQPHPGVSAIAALFPSWRFRLKDASYQVSSNRFLE